MRVAQRLAILFACSLGTLLSFGPAFAQKRVALVIGNGAYQNVAKLSNPTKDADAIAGMLRSAGFEVALHDNVGIHQMRHAVNDFADIARDADTAVVYYSGHGMELNGVNYLIPIDAVLDRDTDVPYETVSLDNLVQVMEPARRLRLVMLDACRDNPFVRSMKRTVGARAVNRGLAPVEPTSVNTLIAYAAKAGSYALDGEGADSPYALALLNHLPTPGLDLRIAFGRVRDEVLKVTKNKQEPFVYGSLGGANISIIDSPGASVTIATPPEQAANSFIDRAAQAWGVIQSTTSIAVIEDFIRQFGSTSFGSMARARLEELKKSQTAVTPLPPTTPPILVPSNNEAAQAWNVIQNTTSIAVLEDFVRQFGSAVYGSMARARLEELKKSQVAVVAPPVAPAVPAGPNVDRNEVLPKTIHLSEHSIWGTYTVTLERTAGSVYEGTFNHGYVTRFTMINFSNHSIKMMRVDNPTVGAVSGTYAGQKSANSAAGEAPLSNGVTVQWQASW